jgi:hypothetical protein
VTSDDTNAPDELPAIEVDVGGTWQRGQLIGWNARPDGLWAQVVYQSDQAQTRSSAFPADRVRPPA